MNAVTATLPPKESTRQRVNVTLGMVFFIGSWSMAFGTLFLSFVVLRQRMAEWPPAGIALPSFPLAAAATAILALSSLVLHRSVRRAEAGERFSGAWMAGILLGLVFAGLQAWLWLDLMGNGRLPESGVYESLFYGLTWFHAVHVVCGLATLLWAWIGIKTGRYGAHRLAFVGNAAIFWHFVDAVWVILFLGFFVF